MTATARLTPAGAAAAAARGAARQVRWALLFGNFVIGCGVMVVPGTLNDLAQSLAGLGRASPAS